MLDKKGQGSRKGGATRTHTPQEQKEAESSALAQGRRREEEVAHVWCENSRHMPGSKNDYGFVALGCAPISLHRRPARVRPQVDLPERLE